MAEDTSDVDKGSWLVESSRTDVIGRLARYQDTRSVAESILKVIAGVLSKRIPIEDGEISVITADYQGEYPCIAVHVPDGGPDESTCERLLDEYESLLKEFELEQFADRMLRIVAGAG